MSARDDVAGLPGGHALADLADKVDAAPDAVRGIARNWVDTAGKCVECQDVVGKSVAELASTWQGASADAFVAYMGTFAQASGSIEDALRNCAGDLDAAATALEGAKTSVNTICEHLLAEVRQLKRDNPDTPEADQRAKIERMVAEAVSAATPKVDEADNALRASASKLGQHLKGMSKKYSALPAPDSQPFAPQPGKTIDWKPRPVPPLQADPQGAAPGAPAGDSPDAPASNPPNEPGGHDGGGHSGGGHGGGGYGGGHSGGGGGGLGPSGGPPPGGGPAPQGQVKEWIDQAIEILKQHGVPVEKMNESDIWAIIQHESGGNARAINLWDCVPLSTMILTRRGWLKHDEVKVGDETIGYRAETGRGQWTRITRVVHHADARLVRLENSRWQATTTPNHSWLNLPRTEVPAEKLPDNCWLCEWPEGRRRRGKTTEGGLRIHLAKMHGVPQEYRGSTYPTTAGFVTTADLTSRDRLLLAAPANTDSRLGISIQEAAILGWIAGDGHVETRKHRPTLSIAQSKPPMAAKLKALLSDIPHALYVDNQSGCGPRHQFRLDYDYAQDLLRRAGNPKTSAVEQVLAMSTEHREAWLEAIVDSEGHRGSQGTVIYQGPGAVLDAIALATYLSGRRPRVLSVRRSGEHDWAPEAAIRGNNPITTAAFLDTVDAGRGEVWCVTTELGTWTAREDDHIFLTGNSNAAAGHPSKGLMQCIDSTFNSHALPGHGDIWNPIDNIIAGVRYSIDRYGSVSNVPGVVGVKRGGGYVGY